MKSGNRKSLYHWILSEAGILKMMFILTGLLSLLLSGCAKIGSPQGGPEDNTPPLFTGSEPDNYSVRFDNQEIEIEFDEYIQLNNLNDELLISPPFEERPVVRIRNKALIIDLNNELVPGTTYTLNFGNAIADNNAGNVLPGFEFVFSTGDYIDSLAVTGETRSAFNRQPPGEDEEVYVMLFSNLNDSAPLKELPRYIGRSGDNGHFSINNIRSDTFRVIALMDMNGNLRYDPLTDAIAFSDSLIVISPATVEDVHLITDTLAIADSVSTTEIMVRAVSLSLDYFRETDSRVYLNEKYRELREKLFFSFTRPPYDSVKVEPLNFRPENAWFLAEYAPDMDTITYWITDPEILAMETVDLLVSYTTVDEAGSLTTRQDTAQLVFRSSEPSARNTREQAMDPAGETQHVLGLSSSLSRSRILNLNGSVGITADRPLAAIDTSFIMLSQTVDTLEQDMGFTLLRDSITGIRHFRIQAVWNEDSRYRLLLLPGAVRDIYGAQNDTLQLQFSTRPADYYGNIQVHLQGEEYPVILQLLNNEEEVVREDYLTASGTIDFNYLAPGSYSLKAISDRNGNRKWDTGNYLKKIQPERTYFYDLPDDTRSSWDYEYTWQIVP